MVLINKVFKIESLFEPAEELELAELLLLSCKIWAKAPLQSLRTNSRWSMEDLDVIFFSIDLKL